MFSSSFALGGRQHRVAKRLDRAVMPRQQLGVGLADMADAERDRSSGAARCVRRRVDRGEQIAHRGLAIALARLSLLVERASRFCSVKMSAGSITQAVVVEVLDLLVAEAVDVERAAATRNASAARPPAPDRSARRCSGAPPRPSSRTAWLPQTGHVFGKLVGLRILRPLVQHDARRPAGSRRRRAGRRRCRRSRISTPSRIGLPSLPMPLM